MSKTIYIYVLPFQRVVHVDVSHNVSNVIMEFFHIQSSHTVILNLLQTLPVFNYTVYFYTVQVRTVLTWFSLFSFWKTYFAKYAPSTFTHRWAGSCPTHGCSGRTVDRPLRYESDDLLMDQYHNQYHISLQQHFMDGYDLDFEYEVY